MTVLEEAQVTDWHRICRHCGRIGDGHSLNCRTLRLAPGWYDRAEWELSRDPFEAEWEKAHASR
jgi:hypothetical protein